MRVASLYKRHAVDLCRWSGGAAPMVELLEHRELQALLHELRHQTVDAVMIEDDELNLHQALSALRLQVGARVPIIVRGHGSAAAMAAALRLGADDTASLADSLQALAERAQARALLLDDTRRQSQLRVGACALDARRQALYTQAREVSLTAREFALAWALFENLGRVVSLNVLTTEIWGRDSDVAKRTIEQHVHKLRRKLDVAHGGACDTPRIKAVYGVGYRLHLMAAVA